MKPSRLFIFFILTLLSSRMSTAQPVSFECSCLLYSCKDAPQLSFEEGQNALLKAKELYNKLTNTEIGSSSYPEEDLSFLLTRYDYKNFPMPLYRAVPKRVEGLVHDFRLITFEREFDVPEEDKKTNGILIHKKGNTEVNTLFSFIKKDMKSVSIWKKLLRFFEMADSKTSDFFYYTQQMVKNKDEGHLSYFSKKIPVDQNSQEGLLLKVLFPKHNIQFLYVDFIVLFENNTPEILLFIRVK